MPADDDEILNAPRRKTGPSHEIGQILDDFSAQELTERIAILKAEIARLEEARSAKQAALGAADAFFNFNWPR
jgi:uncharacterized small protein (DUF1192 family)